jgi:hypothetical protein
MREQPCCCTWSSDKSGRHRWSKCAAYVLNARRSGSSQRPQTRHSHFCRASLWPLIGEPMTHRCTEHCGGTRTRIQHTHIHTYRRAMTLQQRAYCNPTIHTNWFVRGSAFIPHTSPDTRITICASLYSDWFVFGTFQWLSLETQWASERASQSPTTQSLSDFANGMSSSSASANTASIVRQASSYRIEEQPNQPSNRIVVTGELIRYNQCIRSIRTSCSSSSSSSSNGSSSSSSGSIWYLSEYHSIPHVLCSSPCSNR